MSYIFMVDCLFLIFDDISSNPINIATIELEENMKLYYNLKPIIDILNSSILFNLFFFMQNNQGFVNHMFVPLAVNLKLITYFKHFDI